MVDLVIVKCIFCQMVIKHFSHGFPMIFGFSDFSFPMGILLTNWSCGIHHNPLGNSTSSSNLERFHASILMYFDAGDYYAGLCTIPDTEIQDRYGESPWRSMLFYETCLTTRGSCPIHPEDFSTKKTRYPIVRISVEWTSPKNTSIYPLVN